LSKSKPIGGSSKGWISINVTTKKLKYAKRVAATERLHRLYAEAKRLGLNREHLVLEISEMLGCDRSTVYFWIGGRNMVGNAYAARLYELLGYLEKKYEIPS